MRNRQCLCCFARDLHTVELPLLLKRARFLSEPPQTSAFPLHFCDVQNGPEQRALADRDCFQPGQHRQQTLHGLVQKYPNSFSQNTKGQEAAIPNSCRISG